MDVEQGVPEKKGSPVLTIIKFLVFIGLVVALFAFVYHSFQLQETIKVYERQRSTRDDWAEKVSNTLEDELLRTEKYIGNERFFVGLIRRDEPMLYKADFPENKSSLLESHYYLMFVDREDESTRRYDLFELLPEETKEYWRSQPIQLDLQHTPLKWSSFEEDIFWGSIEVYGPADPPVPMTISIHKINTSDWTVEIFLIPNTLVHGLSASSLDPLKERIIYETTPEAGGLVAYVLDLKTLSKKQVVAYPNEVLEEYFGEKYTYVGYYNPSFVGLAEPRTLDTKWEGLDDFSYKNFETREYVRVTIE
jgi:hypothetical protein